MGKKHVRRETTGRRDFLKVAGIGTVLGGASLAVASPAKAKEDGKKGGYRETDHVRTYYKSTRF